MRAEQADTAGRARRARSCAPTWTGSSRASSRRAQARRPCVAPRPRSSGPRCARGRPGAPRLRRGRRPAAPGGHRDRGGAAAASAPGPGGVPRRPGVHVRDPAGSAGPGQAGRRAGSALRVAVQRAPARRGVLVVLAGGPGQPGVPFAAGLGSRLGAAARGWRLVLVDQRGTGAGALRCPALQRAAGRRTSRPRRGGAVTACARRLGARRTHFTTADTVADLDDLRRALRAPRLSLLGTSPTGRSWPSATRWRTRPGPGGSSWTPSCRTRASSSTRTAPLRAAGARAAGGLPARRCPGDPAADLAVGRRRDRRAVELYDALTALSRAGARASPACRRCSTRRADATRRACGRSSRR